MGWLSWLSDLFGGGKVKKAKKVLEKEASSSRPLYGRAITEDGFEAVRQDLKVGPAEIWTVIAVETRGYGFLKSKLPQILFERHIFRRETDGRFDGEAPDISNAKAGGYVGGQAEYGRLQKAASLDRMAALRSASWGLGQIMGFNAEPLGYDSAEDMVDRMRRSEDAQLDGIARFLEENGLQKPLKNHDWATFARRYNGPAYAKNRYDERLAAEYRRFSRGVLPDLNVRAAQLYLEYMGYTPYGIDGIMGSKTRAAIDLFSDVHRLGVDVDALATVPDDLLAKMETEMAKIEATWPL
ncbi:MAG: N-acetylmuramidase domain-containing protein [Pseudomonadota bacterium]